MNIQAASPESFHAVNDGFSYGIRPIKQDDGEKLVDLFNHLSPENRYLRFAHSISELPEDYLKDILELDYQKEMAFVAFTNNHSPTESIIGVVRYICPDESLTCEFSLTVSDTYSAHGVGTNLMHHLIKHAKNQGLAEIYGYVLTSNTKMLTLVKELGFNIEKMKDRSEFKRVALAL